MDPRLLRYYDRELRHLREMGGEFAKEYPKIAGRLGLEGFECADPYVERLLEGFAFLAARIQLRQDAEFPRFTQNLLEIIYPEYLAPTPSMAVVQFQADLNEGSLKDGFRIERGSVLRSVLGKGDQTPCEYRTAHAVDLWPLEFVSAEYTSRDVASVEVQGLQGVRSGLRLRLRCTAGTKFSDLALENLVLYLRGAGEQAMHLYEQLLVNAKAVVVRPTSRSKSWQEVITTAPIRPVGFEDEDALLPAASRSFRAYRLLHEYFAFPERFLFVQFRGLAPAVSRCNESELELIVLFDRLDPRLENAVSTEQFALFCSPVINLFPKRTDRIHVSERQTEFHVVPDRTRPIDFEVYQVQSVTGHGTSADQERAFLPFYAANDFDESADERAYYVASRIPRMLSAKQRKGALRSTYIGSEVFVSLVDTREAPYSTELRQLSLTTLCTNRDLPLQMAVGQGRTDLSMESGAPVKAVRCLNGPTRPRASFAEGEVAWRLISHLSLNYLSLVDNDPQLGAVALRDLLMLYGNVAEAPVRKQIDGVKSVRSSPVVRRVATGGPIAFGRGLEIVLRCEEAAFEGSGVFLLGLVLEQFFSRYVSLNSFTETVLETVERGEVVRWPARLGRRPIL
ncbi:MAG: type VI secretion system baseplate subunit TssF [Planctomycetota bacterium]